MTFPILGGNGAVGGYAIDNSLRFNDDDSAYLRITPTSESNRTTFTFSIWIKRASRLGNFQRIFEVGADTSNRTYITFDSDDKLEINHRDGGVQAVNLTTTAVFRDVSAWYHIVFAVDTTQGTDTNRIKIYVNGTQQTSFDSGLYPSSSKELDFNSTQNHTLGADVNGANEFDGYMAEVNFIDGQAKAHTDFGEFDEDSGIWKPIQYTGTYGTNGFYLDFENSGSLGADQSGNGNNFTPTNLASTDQTTDTPTNNFATLNALDKDGHTNSEGNLKVSGDVVYGMQKSTQGVTTGKWYFEARVNVYQNDTAIALSNENENTYTRFTGETTNSVGYLLDGRFFYNSSSTTYSSTSGGNILQMAFDADSGKIWVGINNTWQNSGNPSAGTNELQTVSWNNFIPTARTVSTGELIFNFGQEGSFAGTATAQGNTDANGFGDFYYEPPTNFLSLCTQNLATELSPTIDDGSEYFNTAIWTGTGSAVNVDVGFQPDWVWLKSRNVVGNHRAFDSNRGATKSLKPNTTDAEATESSYLSSFNSDGFTSSAFSGSTTAVAWNWKANAGSTSSNTDGSITSTVQANTTAGFSIVTYTGTGSNATVGHGLGIAPKIVIVKNRDRVDSWRVGVDSIGFTKQLLLNESDAESTDSLVWQNTAPTSSVFSIGTRNAVNASGEDLVAYCFAEIEGYSKFGSYTGNGSTDGTFSYTGHKSQWLLIKNVEQAGGQWFIYDVKRETFNPLNSSLFAESSQVETANNSALDIDILSNGWKIRNTGSGFNNSGIKYIYMSFASNPFVSSTGIPVTAR